MNSRMVMLVCVGLIALIVRATFVSAVIKINANEYLPFEGSDSPEYLQLAQNFAQLGRYTTDDPRSHLIGLYRTPAYPLYCAAIMKLGGGKRAIVWSQVPLGAGIAVLVAWLASAIFRSNLLGWLAGLLSAFSPTGVGLTAMVLVEVPFELAMVGGFCCMLLAIRRRSTPLALAAGALWAVGGLIKPSLMMWPIAGTVVWFLVARAIEVRVRWRDVILCTAIQLVAFVGWSVRNYVVEDYFTLCAVGGRNLRLLMIPMMEEWKKAGQEPSRADYYTNYAAQGVRQQEFFNKPSANATEFARRQLRESLDEIKKRPLLALRVYLFNLHEQLVTGWNLTDRRMYYQFAHAPKPVPFADPVKRRKQKRAEDAADEAREEASPISWRIFKPLGWITMSPTCEWLWTLSAAASAATIWLHRARPDWRRRAYFTAALWVTVINFAVFAGTVFRAGSRLMYPAEFAVILLILFNIANIFPTHGANTVKSEIE